MSAFAEFWRRFSLNAAAVVGLVFLLLIVAVATFGPARALPGRSLRHDRPALAAARPVSHSAPTYLAGISWQG